MARLEGVPARGLYQRFVYRLMRRMLGRVPLPLRIAARSKGVLRGYVDMERGQQKARVVPAHLRNLAQIRTAMLVGCPF